MDTLMRRLGWTAWDLIFGSVAGLLSGVASAGFLWLLERAIRLRQQHFWLLFLLPFFGLLSAWLYRRFGKDSEGGTGRILDEVLEFRGRVPSRMRRWCSSEHCLHISAAAAQAVKARRCRWGRASLVHWVSCLSPGCA